ncbi:hypothetical protein NUSPORA_01529 [Nucleospora cyclopteri]
MTFYSGKIKDPNIIGIDLGTTNTVAAIMRKGIPVIIKNELDQTMTPSIINQKSKNEFFIGEEAKKLLKTEPENTIFASKRLIGRKMEELKDSEFLKSLPYKTTKVCNGDIWISTKFDKFSPAQIGAKILRKVKNFATNFLGTTVERAVVTVPAYFNDSQRQATKDAGRIAGLDVMRVINEPTAAALAYGLNKNCKGHIAVYDLGGGTFDISILELDDGIFHVKSTNGDTFLGGEDFDNAFVEFLINKFHQQEGIDLRKSSKLSLLKIAAEKAKKELSNKIRTNIFIENITKDTDFDMEITRNQLEAVTKRIAQRTIEPCEKAIRDANIKKSDIKHVILVGGMTRMPYIKKLVEEIFNIKPYDEIDPDEAVAKGAAIQAGILAGNVNDITLLDVIPLSLGIETLGGIFSKVIPRNTTIPFKQEEVFSTSEDDQEEVDIRIYQGERSMVTDNKHLGTFTLKNIPKAEKGKTRIKVTFAADANGILKVSAEDEATKKQQSIEIKASSGLSEEQLTKMIKEAKENELNDVKRKKISEFKNEYKKEVAKYLERTLPPELTVKLIAFQQEYLEKDDFAVEEARKAFKAIF